jgi:hypothetical protein
MPARRLRQALRVGLDAGNVRPLLDGDFTVQLPLGFYPPHAGQPGLGRVLL